MSELVRAYQRLPVNYSEQAQLEQLLYEREREHFALDQHAIVSISNHAGGIIYVNDLFCHTSGYRREELIGRNHRLLKSGYHPDSFYAEMWDTISSGRVWRGDVCNKARNGRFYWVECTITPFMDADGNPYQYISIRTDITHVKEAQAQLAIAKEEAERASQAKSVFLSNMSHELRTPLNAILGFAQILEYDDSLDEDQQDNVNEIVKAGRHLLGLIDEVLDLAKIESGKLMMSLEAVKLCPVLEECLSLIKPLAQQRMISIHQSCPENVAVLADHVRLKQVLLNLLSNAVKYNRENGEVHLTIHTHAQQGVRIQVRDTGMGIPQQRLTELFEPFNRLDAELSGIEGTGIGLTITRRIMEQMGGHISVESELGVGTSFYLELPMTSSSAGEATAEQKQVVPGSEAAYKREYTVLYVEDNHANQKLVASIFAKMPYVRLLSAYQLDLALELVQGYQPDLILLDLHMPGTNGHQLLAALEEYTIRRRVPVVAVSASAMPQDIEAAMAAGFSDYITKPIHVRDFICRIEGWLSLETGD